MPSGQPTRSPSDERSTPRAAYDAFLSYRHGADSELAAALERGLQRLAKPWNHRRAMSVFRDQSDLGADADLTVAITARLDASRYLILLASPESACSPWVEKEVLHWCETRGGTQHVIVVVSGGELDWDQDARAFSAASSAMSPTVRTRFTTEPLFVDLRWARSASELTVSDPRFREAITHIAAPIRGVAPADLDSEDLRLHRRALRRARTGFAVMSVLAVAVSLLALYALAAERRAQEREQDAVARQVGLSVLDLPPNEVDTALLLSLAAADLDSDGGGGQFDASRALLGRYSRLERIVYAPEETLSIRDIGVSPIDDRIVAIGTTDEGRTSMLSWADGVTSDPQRTELNEGIEPTVTVLPDGRTLVGAPPGDVLVIDEAGAPVATIPHAVAIDADSGLVAAATPTGSMRVSRLADGSTVAEEPVDAAAVDIRWGRIAAVSADGLVVIDTNDGTVARAPAEAVGEATVVGVGWDSTAAVTVTATHLTRWRLETEGIEPDDPVVLPDEIGEPRAVVVGRHGTRSLVVGSGGAAVVLLGSRETADVDLGATGLVSADPSGRYVAVGGQRLTIWSLTTGQTIFSVPNPVNSMAWSVSCGESDGACTLVTTGRSLDAWQLGQRRHIQLIDRTNAQAVAISASGSTVASAGWGRTAAVWRLGPIFDHSGRTAADRAEQDDTGGASCGVPADGDVSAVSPGGTLAVTLRTRVDMIVTVCTTDGSPVAEAELEAVADPVSVIAVDDAGNVALGGGTGFVERLVLDVDGSIGADGTIAADETMPDFEENVEEDFEEPLPARFVSGTGIDVRLGGEPVSISELAYNNGTIVAGVHPGRGSMARLLIWPVAAGGMPVQFDTDHLQVVAIALLGDDARHVAVALRDDDDGDVTVQIWDTASQRRLGRALGGLRGDVVALRGDGSVVVGADDSGATFEWEPDGDPTRIICNIVGRPLTADEWNSVAAGRLQPYERIPVCAV